MCRELTKEKVRCSRVPRYYVGDKRAIGYCYPGKFGAGSLICLQHARRARDKDNARLQPVYEIYRLLPGKTGEFAEHWEQVS